MWVRTQKNELINLDFTDLIELKKIATWELNAWTNRNTKKYLLGTYKTKKKAEVALFNIMAHLELEKKTVDLGK